MAIRLIKTQSRAAVTTMHVWALGVPLYRSPVFAFCSIRTQSVTFSSRLASETSFSVTLPLLLTCFASYLRDAELNTAAGGGYKFKGDEEAAGATVPALIFHQTSAFTPLVFSSILQQFSLEARYATYLPGTTISRRHSSRLYCFVRAGMADNRLCFGFAPAVTNKASTADAPLRSMFRAKRNTFLERTLGAIPLRKFWGSGKARRERANQCLIGELGQKKLNKGNSELQHSLRERL